MTFGCGRSEPLWASWVAGDHSKLTARWLPVLGRNSVSSRTLTTAVWICLEAISHGKAGCVKGPSPLLGMILEYQ